MATCYRHPNRETGVSCSSCGRAICPDCMTPTPVGMRCPECARERTPVKTMCNIRSDPVVTYILIAINVLTFIGEFASGGGGLATRGGETAISDGALFGPTITNQDKYYRLITSGFLHPGLPHLPLHTAHVS